MTSRQDYVKAIDIIEHRINLENKETDEKSFDANNSYNEPLSLRGKIMYLLILGDNYSNLLKSMTLSNVKEGKVINPAIKSEFIQRTLSSYQKAYEIATEHLDAVDPIRLLSVSSLCKTISIKSFKIQNGKEKARDLASEAFNFANLHTINCTNEVSLQLLQTLRDDYMIIRNDGDKTKMNGKIKVKPNLGTQSSTNTKDEMALDYDSDCESDIHSTQIEADNGENGKGFIVNKNKPKDGKNLHVKALNQFASSIPGPGSSYFENQISPYALSFVERIRSQVHRSKPIPGEDLMSASEVFAALDKIFRAYVRGNALPGQLESGNAVSLGGKSLSLSNFLLKGPFMSWRGFLCFLRDFCVANAPSKKNKFGKLFPHEIWESEQVPGMIKATLSMEEATCIFIEASKTGYPIIALRTSLPQYAETNITLTKDPYREVAVWIDQENWDIPFGLNFPQFCDAVAKCGNLSYSSSVFKQALPSTQDRIEHFFSAHLGLTQPEKWRRKLENRLIAANKAVKMLKESASAPFLPNISNK